MVCTTFCPLTRVKLTPILTSQNASVDFNIYFAKYRSYKQYLIHRVTNIYHSNTWKNAAVYHSVGNINLVGSGTWQRRLERGRKRWRTPAEKVAGKVSVQVSPKVSPKVSERVSPRVYVNVSEQVSEKVAEAVVGKVAWKVSEKVAHIPRKSGEFQLP